MTFRKKHRAFVHLSRGRRSRAGSLLRQRVERDRHIYGGRFTAHWIIDDEETESFDFIFPGLNKYDIWRACIGTAKNAFRAEINMISIRRAWDMFSPEERAWEQLVQSGAPIHYAQFGGLTLYEYRQRLLREIMAGEVPELPCGFSAKGVTVCAGCDKLWTICGKGRTYGHLHSFQRQEPSRRTAVAQRADRARTPGFGLDGPGPAPA